MAADEEAAGSDGPGPDGSSIGSDDLPTVLAGLLALLFLVLTIVVPDPSRHARGLLIVVDVVCILGVATAWVRVVRLVGVPGAGGGVE